MEKYRTVKQMKEFLSEGGYKFKFGYDDGTKVYWDYDDNKAIVNFSNKTIDYK